MALFKKKADDTLLLPEDRAPEEKASTVKAKKLLKSKFFIPAVAGVILLALVLVLVKTLLGGKSELNYYDTMVSIFSNELGSFSYTFLVETGDKGTLIKEGSTVDISISDLQSAENADTESESSSGDNSTEWDEIAQQNGESYKTDKQFSDWNKYADLKEDNWEHPVYQIKVEGTTMSVDPLLTRFTVSIATRHYNNMFTEVVVRDDTYYFDVESVYNWLSDSSDSYLMSLASEVPHGSKWLAIPASEFAIPSRYAEAGDEQGLSEVHSMVTMYRRFLATLQTATGSIKGYLGDRGVDVRKDVVYLNLVGDDSLAFINAFKSMSTRSGDFYDAVLNACVNKGLYDETQQKQAVREKDNFIAAMNELATYLQVCDPSALKLQASGQVRQYVNGYNNQQIEGVFGVQFCTDTTDYIIKFNGFRNGNQKDITVPDGSKTSENAAMYLSTFNKIVDYFNFTNVKTDVKLSINPDTISEGVLEKFIKLVNDTGSAGYWVTRDNVGEFIEKYKNFQDSAITSPDDIKNSLLVADLVSALDKVVSRDVVIDNPVTQEPPANTDEDPEQYPNLSFELNGVEFHMTHNAELSNHNLFVVDCEFINKSDEAATVDCESFSLRTLMSSIYPANNEVLIRSYDSTFDMSVLEHTLELPAKGWNEFRLYFVLSDDQGHMDLFYGEDQLGALVQF